MKTPFKIPKHRIPVLLKAGRSLNGQYMYVKWLPGDDGGQGGAYCNTPVHWQVLVPTKVAKKAVGRNYFKRVLREVVRASQNKLRVGEWLVIAKPTILEAAYQEILEDFRNIGEHV